MTTTARKHEKTPAAPALARGLELLKCLNLRGTQSLEDLARQTSLPKSSILRLLDTLAQAGAVTRDPAGKRYRALMALLPLGAAGPAFDARVDDALRRLAEQTGATAEWYVPGEQGMVLIRQAEPPDSVVRIRARVGFVRPWVEELDAVAVLAQACFAPAPAKNGRGFNGFERDGVRSELPPKAVLARIRAAADALWAADPHLNANGVRRQAAVVRRGGHPAGVLALAEHAALGAGAPRRDALRRAATELEKLP